MFSIPRRVAGLISEAKPRRLNLLLSEEQNIVYKFVYG
jgi:hypothetical protein